MRNSFGSALIALCVLAAASPLSAALVVFNDDLAGFDALAGAPPVALDFDSIMTGTNLAGDSDSGIAFENLSGGTTLEVVNAATTPYWASTVAIPTTDCSRPADRTSSPPEGLPWCPDRPQARATA
jgi:hypothetical protein